MASEHKEQPQGVGTVQSQKVAEQSSQAALQVAAPGQYRVIRRNGKLALFDREKIKVAMTKAFLAVEGGQAAASTRVHEQVEVLTEQVCQALMRRQADGASFHIEDIQDQVELALMRAGEHKVARSYVLYREQQHARRQQQEKQPERPHELHVVQADGSRQRLDAEHIKGLIQHACRGLVATDAERLYASLQRNLYDGVHQSEVQDCLVMVARALIETEPEYALVAARILFFGLYKDALDLLQKEGLSEPFDVSRLSDYYRQTFPAYLRYGIAQGQIDPRLEEYDTERLAAALDASNDEKFSYLGAQTLYDRYFLKTDERRFEWPQFFFMRVAMGLAINETEREARSIEFYRLLSSFDFMSSTPTLFNSGTLRPQLSSCYLTTVPDNLEGIFEAIKEDALLSKHAGGLGNDWTPVRGMGARIKGTGGLSQGVVPFLKVANDTAVAVNQGGKRKGAVCAYLESWHIDIEEFLELRKNTGDDRRRTHDMNTANWVPDLFLKRVHAGGSWTLFSPDEVSDLHDLYGRAFEQRYQYYEQQAAAGEMRVSKTLPAASLWRKMLSQLFETGHPWLTFKDACNIRSPQSHIGVVHSSNLCTEITLNTSADEIAVCNLGSINLAQHVTSEGLDSDKLKRTIKTAMRMLDNVIDYNYYSVDKARHSNLQHRPVGLGMMGFQDALYHLRLPYASAEAVTFADQTMEQISHLALSSSVDLAIERGHYKTFQGSLWSQGILPIDSIQLLREQRGEEFLAMDESRQLAWEELRQRIQKHGLRNSNVMAIAPTATISNICGVTQSIEPTYQNLFVKSNLSGEFTVINRYLVADLKARGLWDQVMVYDLKYYDGDLEPIDRVPDDLKKLYASAFEIDPRWLVEAASRRQKWLDQGQSLNLYIAEPSGKKLDSLYKLAWLRGLKTTYYLRSRAATQVERSTLEDGGGQLNAVSRQENTVSTAASCSIDDEDCEACQ